MEPKKEDKTQDYWTEILGAFHVVCHFLLPPVLWPDCCCAGDLPVTELRLLEVTCPEFSVLVKR